MRMVKACGLTILVDHSFECFGSFCHPVFGQVEYLGIWEGLYNPSFKPLEFEGVKKEAGLNAFTLSPKKWIDTTIAIGLVIKIFLYLLGLFAF